MKFRFLLLYLIATLILLGAVLPFSAKAALSSSISIDAMPPNPAPNENTSIILNSYENNLDTILITWSVNGKSILSGIGKKSFSTQAPTAGSETTVTATIVLPDGDIEKKIILRPAAMVLLWQANDSYVPPFYKGKALPSPDSNVKVVAMPEIKSGSQMVNPSNMVYAWTQDYTNSQEASGYGKNSFTYRSDYLENLNSISVVASTIDQKYSSEASINIGMTQPKIVFYKNDANLGTIWEQALSDGHRIQGDEVIEAAPYFISPKDIRIPTLTWNWSINDNSVNIVDYLRQNLIPLKVQAGVSGTSKIKLEVNNRDKIFVTASKEINVEF
ncbi:MAG: hypothetical protein AAB902_00250 [Patescibacteria group bacterium]